MGLVNQSLKFYLQKLKSLYLISRIFSPRKRIVTPFTHCLPKSVATTYFLTNSGSSRLRLTPISYYSHVRTRGAIAGGWPDVTVIPYAVGDVSRPLRTPPYRIAIAAPRDGPPTSLGVGAGVAGANPNHIPCSPPYPSRSLLLTPVSPFLSRHRPVFYVSALDPSLPVYLRPDEL